MKRKKERKKHRKVATGSKKTTEPTANGVDNDEGSGGEDEENLVEEPRAPKEPPRKRRKVDRDDEDESSSLSSSESSDEDKQEETKEPVAPPSSTPHPHSPTPPLPSLPVFPLPVAPDAPSKATLALQGLDKALLTAELIDPTLSVPLDSIDKHVGRSACQNVQPVLSEKMKKRLRELGIVELFAGALMLFRPIRYEILIAECCTAFNISSNCFVTFPPSGRTSVKSSVLALRAAEGRLCICADG